MSYCNNLEVLNIRCWSFIFCTVRHSEVRSCHDVTDYQLLLISNQCGDFEL